MIKPTMPNIPGMGAMNDTLEFVKNLWGGMNVPGAGIPGMPGMVVPTLSVEEINKQIADLRAVESWLNVNMNMLRATIQALEVQSATISTLQAMGESFSSAVKSNADATADAVRAATAPRPESASDAERPASAFADDAHAKGTRRRAKAAEQREEAAPDAAQDSGKAGATPEAGASGANDFGAPLANPALWWNMLQDQFKQAVGNAMAPEPGQSGDTDGGGKSGSPAAGKSTRRKPNTKSL